MAAVNAHAEGGDAIHVDYSAPEGCPSKDEFSTAIRARLPDAALRQLDADVLPTFAVSITSGNGEFTGRLSIRSADGTAQSRDVAGDACGEVASALALITALAIDPHSTPGPARPASPKESGPSRVEPIPSTPAPAPEPAASAPVEPDTARAGGRGSDRWHFALGVDASLTGGLAPSLLFGLPVSLEAMAPRKPIAPTFRVSFERATDGSVDANGRTASFAWTVGILEACPNRWTFGRVAVEPCARFEAGTLYAVGTNILPARDDSLTWVAPGLAWRAELSVFDPIFVDVETGVFWALNRKTYFFQPDSTYYAQPSVAGFVGAGIGARFL